MRLGLMTAAALIAAQAASAAEIKDESYRDQYGHRVQQLSVVINAPAAKAWDAFTTDAGYVAWVAPVGHVALDGGGGMMEASYSFKSKIGDPDNIKNEIVAYLPGRMIAIRNAHVPKGAPFDPVLIRTIRTIVTFDDLGNGKTKVTESGVGYGEGAGYDLMYKHFHDGNAEEFDALADSFDKGPIDWKAEAAKMEASVGEKK
ncbi:MAG TPA: SRPBCC domain-containing protein [Rhizomicrobium sp.]